MQSGGVTGLIDIHCIFFLMPVLLNISVVKCSSQTKRLIAFGRIIVVFANFYPTGNYNDGEIFFFHPLGPWNRILLGSASAIGFDQYKKHTVQYRQFIEKFCCRCQWYFCSMLLEFMTLIITLWKSICYPSGSNFCEKS